MVNSFLIFLALGGCVSIPDLAASPYPDRLDTVNIANIKIARKM
jgi:hypothetical protein